MPFFVGPGSSPEGGLEMKSDRVGIPTSTSDPASAVLGDVYMQTVGAGATMRLYNGTAWSRVGGGSLSASGGNSEYSYNGKRIHAFTSPGTFTVNSGSATLEYVVIGGGGSGGSCAGSSGNAGGGGAGAVRVGTLFASSPQPVTVGPGGAAPGAGNAHGNAGSNSVFGPITAPGGGYGSMGDASPKTGGGPGGSGGGGAGGGAVGGNAPGGNGTGDPYAPPLTVSPSNGWGNNGGNGVSSGQGYSGGGGGGAGNNGTNGTTGAGGDGGAAIQLPATFRDPSNPYGDPGPGGADFWVAGGGGGGLNHLGPQSPGSPGRGGGPGGPYAGAGNGGDNGVDATSAVANTGSGGGGTGGDAAGVSAGSGGSGLVLIAYPN